MFLFYISCLFLDLIIEVNMAGLKMTHQYIRERRTQVMVDMMKMVDMKNLITAVLKA